jgi:NCAIR mutase (PurE)-related protein
MEAFEMQSFWLDLLKMVSRGEKSPEDALQELKELPYEELGFAKIDHHRRVRQGMAEVIYCPGKTVDQISQVFKELSSRGGNVMATRANKTIYQRISEECPESVFYELPELIVLWREQKKTQGEVLIVTAGTADQKVAEEAAITAEVLGDTVERLYDVGVAGIHRLLANQNKLNAARVVIVVAGMEGALASVVGGLVNAPVISVPTSVGYGANFMGLAPLLTMLNSCANGSAVVNIDNGFGAAMIAHRINMIGEELP